MYIGGGGGDREGERGRHGEKETDRYEREEE
jgi:hypothetical protein